MSACLWGSRGEKRVKEVLNYKKPSFWILLAAVVVCVIVAVCFLTNPKDGTTVVLTNEAGNSEADAATNAALEQAAAKQEEVEQLKESLAAQQESLAEGLDTAKQENTTGIYVENSSYSGFFTAKGMLLMHRWKWAEHPFSWYRMDPIRTEIIPMQSPVMSTVWERMQRRRSWVA